MRCEAFFLLCAFLRRLLPPLRHKTICFPLRDDPHRFRGEGVVTSSRYAVEEGGDEVTVPSPDVLTRGRGLSTLRRATPVPLLYVEESDVSCV